MKKITVFIVSMWFFIFGIVVNVNATDVSGIINTDTTWDLTGSPYTITDTIQVIDGVTLTIEPGVVINGLPNGGGYYIELWGNLIAVGTENLPVIFNYLGINIKKDSASIAIIRHCEIYGGIIYGKYQGTLTIQDSIFYGGWPVIENGNCLIERNVFTGSSGIFLQTSEQSVIRNNVFNNNGERNIEESIYIRTNCSQTIIEKNTFMNTENVNVKIYSSDNTCNIIAQYNYWGTTDTSKIDQMIYDHNDDYNVGTVYYLPILSEPDIDTPFYQLNSPPIADAGPDQIVFDTLTFDASESSDPDEDTLTYEWQVQHATEPSISYLLEGEIVTLPDLETGFYNVTLTVTDFEGASDTDDMFFSATGLKGDFDFDGDVDGEDLSEFSENFGW